MVDEVHRKVYVINVGDSRVYKINANKICQITKDHSLVQRLVDSKPTDTGGSPQPSERESDISHAWRKEQCRN